MLEPLLNLLPVLRHQLTEPLRVVLFHIVEMLALALLEPILHALKRLRVGLFQMRQPVAHLFLTLLDFLFKRLRILLLQLAKTLNLFLRRPLAVGHIFSPIAHVFPSVSDILTVIPHVFAPVGDIFEVITKPTVVLGIPDVLSPIAHVFLTIDDIFCPIADIFPGPPVAIAGAGPVVSWACLRRFGVGNAHRARHTHHYHHRSRNQDVSHDSLLCPTQ